jgi:hypothetical protein
MMEGYHVLDRPWDERERYELLGRMEGNIPGYLSYSAEEGEVVCVFESTTEAEQFYTHKEQLREFKRRATERAEEVKGRFEWMRHSLLAVVGGNLPLFEEASLTSIGFLDKGIPKC